MILQRQIEQRGKRRKCLDADIRLSCQKPGVRTCRPVEHPGRNFKPPICLRRFQRAAEDDKTILVDGTMNANSATTPRMMSITNLTKNGPVGVLKRRCTIERGATPPSATSARSDGAKRAPTGPGRRFGLRPSKHPKYWVSACGPGRQGAPQTFPYSEF